MATNPSDQPQFGRPEQVPALDVLAAGPLRVMVNGTEYFISPLELRDMADAVGRLRQERLQALLPFQGKLPAAILSSALAQCAATDPTDDEFWAYVHTERGYVFMVWRSLVKRHLALAEQAVWKLVESSPDIVRLVYVHSGFSAPPIAGQEGAVAAENPTEPPVFGRQQTGSETPPSSLNDSLDGDSKTS